MVGQPRKMHTGPEPKRFPVQIHDQRNHWRPAELECSGDDLIANATPDYVYGAPGSQGQPEEVARQKLKGIEPGDEIVTVGYPEAEYRDVAVERDGKTLAIIGLSPTEQGGWLVGGYSACPSAGISS